jgi:hypothetical protein
MRHFGTSWDKMGHGVNRKTEKPENVKLKKCWNPTFSLSAEGLQAGVYLFFG